MKFNRSIDRWIRFLPPLAILFCWVAFAPPALAAGKDIFGAVLGLKTQVRPDARTARFLGTERRGSAILIDDNGLALTIGYLILEADGTVLTDSQGKETPADIVAYDHQTGFGLVRAHGSLAGKPLRLGKSSKLAARDRVLVASRSGGQQVSATQVVSRRDFAGGWEYLLEKAIFTSPPHDHHSGAALIGEDGRLLGIGSLFVADAAGTNTPLPGNMFVPIDGLKPILAELLENGRRAGPGRPWIGANTTEMVGRVLVARISRGGPASKAGLEIGDLILGVGGKPVRNQMDFYRKLWATGGAGVVVPLDILPAPGGKLEIQRLEIRSGDRYDWLKMRRGF